MRLAVVLVLALAAPTVAQERFAPGVPMFWEFEQDCRRDEQSPPIEKACAKGLNEGWSVYTGDDRGICDFAAFWSTADRLKSDTFRVLPWQTAVEFVFEEMGPCLTLGADPVVNFRD